MNQGYADASCVLRINVDCYDCKMTMMEILSSIAGAYNVNIEADEGLVKISGEVDPNMLLRAIGRPGGHGKLVRTRITHPAVANKRSNQNPADRGHDNPCNIDYAHHCNHNGIGAGGALEGPAPLPVPDHLGDAWDRPLPGSIHVPSYPPREYDPSHEDENWYCSIM